MKQKFQTVFFVLLAAILFACSPATPVVQEAAPTSSGGLHPLTTTTGVEEVDRLVEVVASGDPQTLRSLIQFTDTKCTMAEGLGGPPKCREGEAEGTPVEVLPILGSEGHFFHKEEIEEWAGVDAEGLYAIYEVSSNAYSEPDYPSGDYAVMFFNKKDQEVISLRVANGKIVRVDYLFDTSPKELNGWIEREASHVILAPVQ